MKKYDNYKDSGIEWLGEIPENWEMWKISHAFKRIGSGTTPESGNPLYHENGTINWLNTGDLNDGILNSCNKKVTAKALEDFSSLKIFPAGSLVMAMYGATIGKTSIINFDTTTNQACCVFCKGEIIDVKFLQYWFIGNKEHIINLAIGGGQPNISQNILKDVRVSCPNFNEQTAIANYLDHKTTQIDTLIAKKEQFISLLQEERTAVINQAVTKGLDPKVKMKDSGIEWLGEIPEHWEVKKLKYFANVVLGKMLTTEDKGDYHLKPYLRAKNIEWNKPNIDDVKEMWFSNNEIINFRIKKNDLLVSEGGEVGRTCIWNDELNECYIQNSVHKVTILEDGDSNYFLNQFVLFGKMGHFDAIVNRISIAHLTKEKLKDVSFFYPPKNEQSEISNYIQVKSAEIDDLISKSQQEIELLKEYKTALLSEVVTGKVDVRDVILN